MMPEPQLQYFETARMLVLRGSGKRHQPRLAGAGFRLDGLPKPAESQNMVVVLADCGAARDLHIITA